MRIAFHPLPFFTAASAFLLAVLAGLGVWQLERLDWKLKLIADVNTHLRAPPISATEALALGDGAQYRRVVLAGSFDNTKENYAFATGASGDAGYHVVTPFRTAQGWLLVDRGFVPQALRDPALRRAGQLEGERRIIGVWRVPDQPSYFTPAPDRSRRIWYARDVQAMAKADGIPLLASVIVEIDSSPVPGGWPKGGQTVVQFRNEHLQYAITWFALALCLIGVYLAYHHSRGRLKLVR